MKVLYAAFDLVPAPKGAGRHIEAFTRALVAAGHEVTLFTVGLPTMPAKETWAGARLLRASLPAGNFLRRALYFGDAVWEHLRQQGVSGGYDVVHFRDIWSGDAALEARRRFGYRYRTLFEANGLPSVELKYHYPALADSDLPARLRAQEQAILREVEAVVCVSAVTAIFVQSLGAPPQAVTVIPNGVDPALFRPAEGPPDQPPRLVYAGTLAAWQGIATALEAMPFILAAFPETTLHLIGPAKSRHQKGLVKRAAKLGLGEDTVRFVGPVEPGKMPARLQAASVCLAPLPYNDRNVTQGCCPIKVLEYAAVGRPIVAADLPVVRELLAEGAARFFRPGDAADLARQTIHLLTHPQEAQAMARRAAEQVRGTFTWQRAGEQLLAVYERLATTSPPGTGPTSSTALAPA